MVAKGSPQKITVREARERIRGAETEVLARIERLLRGLPQHARVADVIAEALGRCRHNLGRGSEQAARQQLSAKVSEM
jgi:hypothetical protein